MDLEEANPKYIPVTVTPPAKGVAQGVLNAARSRCYSSRTAYSRAPSATARITPRVRSGSRTTLKAA